jgi:phosphomannomutase
MKEPLQDLEKLRQKELIVFDIDGTLTPSKAPADKEMIELLLELLNKKSVAIIGGGKYELFKEQLVVQLPNDKSLERLYLFPTNSTAFYRFINNEWKQIYYHELSEEEREKIKLAFEETFSELNYLHPKETYGPVIEDRGTQVTFSALGQEIVAMLGEDGVKQKEEWNKKYDDLRQKMRAMLQEKLPEFEVRAGGLTSIDITRKGIDKAYGVNQISEHLDVKIEDMLFVGDAIFPGGNDYAALETGIDYVKVENPNDTKALIKRII